MLHFKEVKILDDVHVQVVLKPLYFIALQHLM